jgi:putative spermidine/putrescine transport system substrate-binding protein
MDKVLFNPVAERNGWTVRTETHDQAIGLMRLEAASGNVTTDIFAVGAYEVKIAHDEGIVDEYDISGIDQSKFIPGTINNYCVGSFGFGIVLGWNAEKYKDNPPTTWADFWDVEKFPGDRAMANYAEGMLEAALMADGVEKSEVYTILKTEEGKQRAIAKIREIKPNVTVWWASGAQVTQIMRDQEVDMAIGYNARFQAAKEDGAAVDYTFNDGMLAYICYGVMKDAPNKEAAIKMVTEVSNAEPLAELTKYMTYGPVNLAAYDTGIVPPDRVDILSTTPALASTLLVQDTEYYAEHVARAGELYEALLAE